MSNNKCNNKEKKARESHRLTGEVEEGCVQALRCFLDGPENLLANVACHCRNGRAVD